MQGAATRRSRRRNGERRANRARLSFLARAIRSGYLTPASAADAVASPDPVASAPQQVSVVEPSGLEIVRQPGSSLIAVDVRIASTCDAVRLGFFCSMSAAIPATCGDAIEVPPRKK